MTVQWIFNMFTILRFYPPSVIRSLLFCGLLDEFPLVVLLSNPVWDVCSYGSQLLGPFNVKHLVVEKDVRFDFLQEWPFRSSGQEEGLVDFQAPATEGFQDTGSWAGSAAGRYQECSDGTVHTLVLGVEFSLELPQSLQETLQRTLKASKRSRSFKKVFSTGDGEHKYRKTHRYMQYGTTNYKERASLSKQWLYILSI